MVPLEEFVQNSKPDKAETKLIERVRLRENQPMHKPIHEFANLNASSHETTLADCPSKVACCTQVAAAADHVLSQCAAMIALTTAELMVAPSKVLPGGTIGKHVRHMVDHFNAAAEAATTGICIDYDHRERNVPMEREPKAALEAIALVRDRLVEAANAKSDFLVKMRVMLSAMGDEAELLSTAGREIAFATHHGVHHQAMMRAIATELGMKINEDFGKAPSTLHYERYTHKPLTCGLNANCS